MKYVSKPTTVNAVQYRADNHDEFVAALGLTEMPHAYADGDIILQELIVARGEYVILDDDGGLTLMSRSEFEARYARLTETNPLTILGEYFGDDFSEADARELAVLDGYECSYDHHGYCQAHGLGLNPTLCVVGLALYSFHPDSDAQ